MRLPFFIDFIFPNHSACLPSYDLLYLEVSNNVIVFERKIVQCMHLCNTNFSIGYVILHFAFNKKFQKLILINYSSILFWYSILSELKADFWRKVKNKIKNLVLAHKHNKHARQIKDWPVGPTVTQLSLKRKVRGSNLGPVKSDRVLPTARYCCDLSLKEAVLPGSNDAEMSPANLLHASA